MKKLNRFMPPISTAFLLCFLATGSQAQDTSSCSTNNQESPDCVPVVIPFGGSPVMGYCQDEAVMSGVGPIYYGSNSTSAYITCTDVGNEPISGQETEIIAADAKCPNGGFVIGLQMNSNETIKQVECAIIQNIGATGTPDKSNRTPEEDWAKTIGPPVTCAANFYVVGFFQQRNNNNDSYGVYCREAVSTE
ncbi:MAG: hypothetical protein AAFQ88_02740 [Pseudomonadota bacterium]